MSGHIVISYGPGEPESFVVELDDEFWLRDAQVLIRRQADRGGAVGIDYANVPEERKREVYKLLEDARVDAGIRTSTSSIHDDNAPQAPFTNRHERRVALSRRRRIR